MLSCPVCGKLFSLKPNLEYHLTNNCGPQGKFSGIKCGGCECIFSTRKLLCTHLVENHDVTLETDELSFSSTDEFLIWKSELEEEEQVSYITYDSISLKNGSKRKYYRCHRSGFFRSRSTGKKLMATNKIDSTCPSSIVATISRKNSVSVTYTKTHFGHSSSSERPSKSLLKRKKLKTDEDSEPVKADRTLIVVQDNIKIKDELLSPVTRRTSTHSEQQNHSVSQPVNKPELLKSKEGPKSPGAIFKMVEPNQGYLLIQPKETVRDRLRKKTSKLLSRLNSNIKTDDLTLGKIDEIMGVLLDMVNSEQNQNDVQELYIHDGFDHCY